jgi:phage gpG-like protein
MAITIKIKMNPSAQELKTKFGSIDFEGFLNRKITELAYRIERESKQVTPVDTGRLRASIYTEIGNLKAKVQPDVFYDIFVHEGTRYMRARPFMLWGTETATTNFESDLNRDLERHIQSKIGKS